MEAWTEAWTNDECGCEALLLCEWAEEQLDLFRPVLRHVILEPSLFCAKDHTDEIRSALRRSERGR